mmetsp:Transcript_9701/g.24880  ORF Transcript_9701/g.24880 Transcript_9701/m.24880 type:complete len:681 (-) Transcript_9701:510-2552(-)
MVSLTLVAAVWAASVGSSAGSASVQPPRSRWAARVGSSDATLTPTAMVARAAARHGASGRALEIPRGGAKNGELAPILVVGSLNVDITLEVDRLPERGETITTADPNSGRTACGGKGANQAVAASQLCDASAGRSTKFVCQFGNDGHAPMLEKTLSERGVDLSSAGHSTTAPSGSGYVLLCGDGTVSSVVVGGSNVDWPESTDYAALVSGAGIVLLQREVPEAVNMAIVKAANAQGVPVLQDAGGEDRPISDELLSMITYLSPNLTELARLTGLPTSTDDEVLEAARSLLKRGAQNVLVTLGSRGSLLVGEAAGEEGLLRQECAAVPGGVVVDETGAGDCFRAGFTVALVEGRPIKECMRFAAAAGAIAVSRMGAVPSCPHRDETAALANTISPGPELDLRGGGGDSLDKVEEVDEMARLGFASRLNSMKDRLDLWEGDNDVLGWVERQGTIKGLTMVDFNYPQHLSELSYDDARGALSSAGLKAGAVCLRFPKEMQAGAFTHPDEAMRAKAIKLTKEACEWATELGAEEVVVWSAYCGYDYSLQVSYPEVWSQVVEAFREVCDAYPQIKVSLEFKPTDENTRFFVVPSSGAALLLANEIDRPNFGLTLDFGHCLAAGENPAQSAAMVGSAGKLFGVQLNDGYQRLGAEVRWKSRFARARNQSATAASQQILPHRRQRAL